jgi:hypothetical protein
MAKYSIFAALILMLLGVCSCAAVDRQRISIETVDAMPDFPRPYEMRDWDKVARDFDALVFDATKKGPYLPLVRFAPRPGAADKPMFFMPSHVGLQLDSMETITCFGAVGGALVAGVDPDPGRSNRIELAANFFDDKRGLYLNDIDGASGKSFWYEIYPSVLFYRIYHFAPESDRMRKQFYQTADKWHAACAAMGGSTSPPATPDFDYTAFSFEKMEPVDNKIWKEPDAAAGIAWLEYLAYAKGGRKDNKYLDAAKWSMDYLQQSEKSPFYEVLMPLGAYTAARMNAELGTDYDTRRFVNWCFGGSNRRGWGVTTGKWGAYDCAGLVGNVRNRRNMQAFAMNSFDMAASLVPIVRYDDRFADAIGKWMLNLANNARLFYPQSLPESHQTDYNWSRRYDPQSCIAYEGLRQAKIRIDRIKADRETNAGRVLSGAVKQLIGTDRIYQCVEEGPRDSLEHVWELKLSPAAGRELFLVGKTEGVDGEAFSFSYSESPSGPFKPLFDFSSAEDREMSGRLDVSSPVAYLKVVDSGKPAGAKGRDRIYIDDIWIVSKSANTPLAAGYAKTSRWGKTNLGVYGSAQVGILAGIVNKTNVKGILQLDCLATDFHRSEAYPTYLYYNPHDAPKEVEIDLGQAPRDLYETVGNVFVARAASGKVRVTIPPKSSRVIVICPAGGKLVRDGSKTLVNGVVIDYR